MPSQNVLWGQSLRTSLTYDVDQQFQASQDEGWRQSSKSKFRQFKQESPHCKKHHFVPNIYINLNQSNIEATQDIYLLQSEFVVAKHISPAAQKIVWKLSVPKMSMLF